MTHDLVESMAGHRTRLAQLPADRWHDGEDEALEKYLKSSKAMDQSTARLIALVPRGWLVLGLLGLAPAFVYGNCFARAHRDRGRRHAARLSRVETARGRGMAVGRRRGGMAANVRSLPRRDAPGITRSALDVVPTKTRRWWCDARDLVFRYSDRSGARAARRKSQIARGERLVLEGASGGGKSTLVSLLTGVREPNSGQRAHRWIRSPDAGRRRMAQTPGRRAAVP